MPINFIEQSAPLTPASGKLILYAKTDKNLYFKDSDGIEKSVGFAGSVGVTQGGTGLNAATQGDILYSSATNTLARLPKNTTATRYLANTGTSNNPQWDRINLGNGVNGTLPVGNGGTGATTLSSGNILRGNGTSAVTATLGLHTTITASATHVPTSTAVINFAPKKSGFDNITVGTTEPTSPSTGDLWVDTN